MGSFTSESGFGDIRSPSEASSGFSSALSGALRSISDRCGFSGGGFGFGRFFFFFWAGLEGLEGGPLSFRAPLVVGV